MARVGRAHGPVIADAQMTRTEWLQWLTKCCRFDPRKLFDATGKPKPITELDENEAAAIQQYELHAELPAPDGSRKAFTVKLKFSDRVSALALLGKACHWYADRREGTLEPEGGSMQKNIVVEFVKPSMSQEEAYERMVTGP
jgi:phage terminase small subunit